MTTSDVITKRELKEAFEKIKNKNGFDLRVFEEGSNQDQLSFDKGGCTFQHKGKVYGSCDAVIYKKNLVIAIEMTDALNRGSSGSAQAQRFHHALGPALIGHLGIYYLRKGRHKIRPDLFGMASNLSKKEKGSYFITDDLKILNKILEIYGTDKFFEYKKNYIKYMQDIFIENFKKKYGNWDKYYKARSTLEMENYILRYQANSYISFTEGQARGGHLALGELFLGKYLFNDVNTEKKKLYFFLPRLRKNELNDLKKREKTNKELYLFLNEKNTEIKTIDDLKNLPKEIFEGFEFLKKKNLNVNPNKKNYKKYMNKIIKGLKDKTINFL